MPKPQNTGSATVHYKSNVMHVLHENILPWITCSTPWHALFDSSVSCANHTRCNMDCNRVETIREFERPSGQISVHKPTIQKIAQEKHNNVKANQTSTTSDEFCECLRSLG